MNFLKVHGELFTKILKNVCPKKKRTPCTKVLILKTFYKYHFPRLLKIAALQKNLKTGPKSVIYLHQQHKNEKRNTNFCTGNIFCLKRAKHSQLVGLVLLQMWPIKPQEKTEIEKKKQVKSCFLIFYDFRILRLLIFSENILNISKNSKITIWLKVKGVTFYWTSFFFDKIYKFQQNLKFQKNNRKNKVQNQIKIYGKKLCEK